jgi:uncharacterized protein (TIGR03086 family)
MRTVTGTQPTPGETADRVARLIELGLDRAAAELGAAGAAAPTALAVPSTGASMEPLEQLDQLGPLLAKVVGNVRPDQLDARTPCAGFAVRDVLAHMLGGAAAFAAGFRGREAPAAEPPADVLAAFGPALTDLAAAMHEPGALGRTIQAPFGAVDGTAFARFVVLDGLVHGWDVAVATGQAYDPPDALVAAVSAFASGALDGLRDGETFAAATEPPADASPIERLAAYTGRRVVRAA